jgi:type IV pilus assembly protein PilY1
LFIINALTGELIWKAIGTTDTLASYDSSILAYKHPDLLDSAASSPTILDTDGDGLLERVYFPDTGGNVWRVNVADPDRSNWTLTKLFSGGRHFQADNANDRRFFHTPDVVFAEDATGNFDAVILTSGDRAHPLGEDVENWIYMIKDRISEPTVTQTLPLTHSDLADLSDNCLQDQADDIENLDFTTCTDTNAESSIVNGWKVRLEQCEAGGTNVACGEKGLSSPVTVEGIILFTTYLPVLDTIVSETPTTCGTKEGSGLLYGLDLQTAGGATNLDPSNDAGTETLDRFVKLKSPSIPSDVVIIDAENILPPDLIIRKIPGRKSAKTFWYERRFN